MRSICGNGWTRTNMPKREFYGLLGIPAPNISIYGDDEIRTHVLIRPLLRVKVVNPHSVPIQSAHTTLPHSQLVRVEGFEPPVFLCFGFTDRSHSTTVTVPSCTCFSQKQPIYNCFYAAICVFMQTKKPDSFESGLLRIHCLRNHYLSFAYGHNIPDSHKILFIRFFTEIICTKCKHNFIL
jgi:hypothetical protein